MNVVITKVPVADAIKGNKITHNVNNLWDDGQRPRDYDLVISQCKTGTWIDMFREAYFVLIIAPEDVKWMQNAAEVTRITGHYDTFPILFTYELDQFERKVQTELAWWHDAVFGNSTTTSQSTQRRYFVRSEKVSLKCGMHGAGPYTSLRQIVESIVTCSRPTHHPLMNLSRGTPLKLYLLPWLDDVQSDLEFRVFVNHNRVVAISQQNFDVPNITLRRMSPKEVERTVTDWTRTISHFVTTQVPFERAVLDIALLRSQNMQAFLIEVNPFGASFPSGSALFHWQKDQDILEGSNSENEKEIHFRYSV